MDGLLARLRILIAAGLVMLVAPAATTAQPLFSVLHSFSGASDGSRPDGALIQATDGNFYGTTSTGGAFNAGTVFRMTPAGTVTVLHAFTGGLDGCGPLAALIQATDGNFYGTTTYGGSSSSLCANGGTVFKMTPDGAVTTLHVFAGGTDGRLPQAALIQATDGSFYGTTKYGGARSPSCALGCGIIFNVTSAGIVTVLHAFQYADGAYPIASLIQAIDGDFYGTTVGERVGGSFVPVASVAFKMTSAGTFTVLHDFAFAGLGGAVDAANGALIQATDGNFYGTTSGLSMVPCFNQCGKVFRMTPAGSIEYVHRFTGGTDGSYPSASLIQAADGNFYGLTSSGGGPPCASFFSFPFPCHGTVFKMTPTGIVTNLHAFTTGADGTEPSPNASLVQASDGSIYGATPGGGEFGRGVVFRFIMTPHLLDLNGDGRGDVFLYNQATGERRVESANGVTTGFTESSGRWDPGWQIYPVNLDRDPFTDFFLYDPARGLWAQALNHAGDGTFTYTFGNWEKNWTVVPADLDGDGVSDLFVYNSATGVWVRCLVDGVGGFKHYFPGRWDPGWTFHTADLNGDRRDDLLLYNRESGVWVEAFSLDWLSGFNYPASGQWGPGWQVTPANLNGDDRMDLLLLNAAGGHVSALGRAGAGFDYVVGAQWSPGWTVAPGDLNKDGTDDLFLYNPVTGVWVEAFSDGAGSFTYTAGQWDPGWAVALTHFNGDGVPDLILSRADGTWVQATATGSGTFTYIVGNWGPAWTVFARRLGAG